MKQNLLDKLKLGASAPPNNIVQLSVEHCDVLLRLYEAAAKFDVWATRHNYPRGELRAALDGVEIA